MRRFFKIFCTICLFSINGLLAQDSPIKPSFKWITPTADDVMGRVPSGEDGFGRLPGEMQSSLRDPVWRLSTNSAGLYLNFKTTASSFVVRYSVKGRLNMLHMATTGVSGVDLYALDCNTKTWRWANGQYKFKDTVTYVFENIRKGGEERVYRLYLPLYNSVDWLEIGIPPSDSIQFLSDKEKPIIVYGTSIAQGACASRPGLAWTNILNRKSGRPIINLGFSGNGRLEKPILDLIAKTPAEIIVLDCLPNLGITAERSESQLDSIIYNAVRLIREHQPETPIILTEHSSGFNPNILNEKTLQSYERSTKVARGTFARLRDAGVGDLYLLSNQAIGLDINSTVDYAHPNDLGMMKIADAYHNLIKKIKDEER